MKQHKEKEKVGTTYKIKDLKVAKKILMLIDGYRKFNIEDFEWADKEVKEKKMGMRFISDWEKIRKIMLKFAIEAGSQRHLLKLAAIQQLFIQIGLVISSIITILATSVALGHFFHFKWADTVFTIFSYALVPLIILMLITFIIPPIIARKISIKLENYYRRKPEFINRADKLLFCVAQNIIYSIAESIKTGRLTSKRKKDFEVWLFNVDYKGIKVKKKPFLFRGYYVAALDFSD
jgi:hypothetical protein